MAEEEKEKGDRASFLYAASPSSHREQMRPSLAAGVQDTRVNLLHVLDDDDERAVSGPASPTHAAHAGPAIFVQLSNAVRVFARRSSHVPTASAPMGVVALESKVD